MYWQLQHVIFVWQSWHLVTLRHFQCRFAWPAHYVRLKEKCVCSDRRIFLVSIPTSSNVSTPLVAQGIVNMCLLNHRSCISFFLRKGAQLCPKSIILHSAWQVFALMHHLLLQNSSITNVDLSYVSLILASPQTVPRPPLNHVSNNIFGFFKDPFPTIII